MHVISYSKDPHIREGMKQQRVCLYPFRCPMYTLLFVPSKEIFTKGIPSSHAIRWNVIGITIYEFRIKEY